MLRHVPLPHTQTRKYLTETSSHSLCNALCHPFTNQKMNSTSRLPFIPQHTILTWTSLHVTSPCSSATSSCCLAGISVNILQAKIHQSVAYYPWDTTSVFSVCCTRCSVELILPTSPAWSQLFNVCPVLQAYQLLGVSPNKVHTL